MRIYIYIMATVSISAPSAPAHPLRNPGFRLLWTGRAISSLGDQFYLVALPWLVLQLTSSSVALGTIMMTAAVPQAVFMLLGGAVSDRVSPRRVWMTTTSARTLCVAVIGALVWLHVLQLWQIYVLALAFGIADAFAAPAAQAFLPSVVEKEQLPAANSVTQATQQLAAIVGPAPAGIVVKALGTAWAFIIDAVSFLFVIAALWKLPDPPPPPAAVRKTGVFHSIAQGLYYIAGDPALRSLLLLAVAVNFCLTGPMSIGLPWIAKSVFASPIAFSVFVTSVAAGGLTGVLLAGWIKPRKRGLLMLGVSAFIGACVAVFGLFANIAIFAVTLFAIGTAAGFLNVHIIAWFQQRVDREMLGRAMSVLSLAAIGLQPISLFVAGVAVTWSLAAMFIGAAALVLVAAAVVALHSSVREIE